MSIFKIASWNVNSLRVRLSHVLTWLQKVKPDVLAIQETKLLDTDFPFAALNEVGFSVICAGQKAYNGVALLSRDKMEEVITDVPLIEDPQRRLIGATIKDIRFLNLYVPNGESVISAKYQYKLNWLHHLRLFLQQELQRYPNMIVLGDFNIAPAEIDVYDPLLCGGQVLFSEPERKAFQDILQIGFQDCFRQCSPTEKSFTWWDYRLNAFKRNRGLRIDHILASRPLVPRLMTCQIDKEPRGWERPSDHAPVVAVFQC